MAINRVTRLTFIVSTLILAFTPYSSRPARQSQPTLQITAPSSGTIVNPGQTVTINIASNSPAAFQGVALLGDDPIGLVGTVSALPGQLSLSVPASGITCGSHILTVEGTPNSGGGPVYASISIDVERPDFPVSFSAMLPGLAFESLGEQTALVLLANFYDGTTFGVSGSSYVAYTSSNNAVATVNPSGVVTAAGPGIASITATYAISGQSLQVPIPVNVSPPKLGVSPASVAFPGQSAGTSSGPQQLTLTNASIDNISIPSLATSGDFSETDTCVASSPLAPSGTCTANVTFSPTAAGTRTGSLNISNSANSVPISIPLAGTGTTAPAITSLSPSSGAVGASVTITGVNFGGSQGTSTVTFNGTTATPTSWSATSIVAPVPSGATTGNVLVTVGGMASNGVAFTVSPSISTLNPTSGAVGSSVTITGTNFGATQGASTLKFNGTTATPTSWSATSIVAPVPSGATTGNVVVTVGGVASNGVNFAVNSSTYVQGSSASQTSATAITASFSSPETLLDLNVVVIACYGSAACQISSVTDTNLNTYNLAVGPTTLTSGSTTLSQAIYYASVGNNAKGNAVTVTFKKATGQAELRIAEYTALSSIDAKAANAASIPFTGASIPTPASSGSATTTYWHDFLVAADTTNVVTAGAGPGFTARIITSSNSNLLEDEEITATGTYSATAPLQPPPGTTSGTALYIMQMVAFSFMHSGPPGD